MSNTQYIVLLATIIFSGGFAAGDSDSGFGAIILAGILYGLAFYMWVLS